MSANGLIKYTDIDLLLKDIRNIEENMSPADAVKALCELYLELPTAANEMAKLDPYRNDYVLAAINL